MNKILIIEDDDNLANELKNLLENAGFKTHILKDFKNALEEIQNTNADLILLDINIPYSNGEQLIKQIREKMKTPVIMVTSRNTEIDEVISMSYGADDYITKPYNPTILLLRINAILKRIENTTDFISYKDAIIYMQKGMIKKEEKEILLTKNEMLIFNYLLNNRNKIVTRDELMTELWNYEDYINDNAITVNISRLRNKLNTIGLGNPITTRKKVGYILT